MLRKVNKPENVLVFYDFGWVSEEGRGSKRDDKNGSVAALALPLHV